MQPYECILINPRSIYYSKGHNSPPYLCAGLLSIASLLESKGCRTFILDMVAEEDPLAVLEDYLGKAPGKVLVVGLTVMTSQIKHAIELSAHIKNRHPEIRIIWGGIHPSLFPEDILRESLADFVCAGEGEYTLYELLSALKTGADLKTIKGLYFRKGGEIVSTGPRRPNDLETLPFFNFDLINYSRYRTRIVPTERGPEEVRFGVVISSVGCPYRCTFCVNTNKQLHFGGYRSKSAGRIVDELEFLANKYGINYFDFLDENFFVDKRRVGEFLRELKSRGLKFKWYTNMRADAFDRQIVDEQTLKELNREGLHWLGIGAESGSQRILDKLKKDISVEQIYRSAELVTGAGIRISYSFIMGLPGETRRETEATLQMVRDLKTCDKKISIIGPQIFRPYPGGELYEECVNQLGYVPPRTTAEWGRASDLLTGFDNIEKLTWIPDREFIKKAVFYTEIINMDLETLDCGPARRLIFSVLKRLAALRIRYRFWSLNWEMRLILFYRNWRSRRLNSL